jgi:hypothetical protein
LARRDQGVSVHRALAAKYDIADLEEVTAQALLDIDRDTL